MEEHLSHERILIVAALFLCALIIGYNAFFVPEAEPTVLHLEQASGMEASSAGTGAFREDGKLDLNAATAAQLAELLPGVGEVTAGKIVAYREEHGGFQSLDELKNIDGIGDKTYEKIAPFLYLG